MTTLYGGRAVQRRRGTTADHAAFTGLQGEVTVDTNKNVVVVHDGLTPGGHPMAAEGEIPEGAVASDTIVHIETLTQAQYDALASPDAFTLYVIVEPFLAARTAHFVRTGYDLEFLL